MQEKDRLFQASFRYSEDFLQFWEAYPRKVAKTAAYKAFKRQTSVLSVPAGVIIHSVVTWAKTDQWKQKKFVPHPTTFLNQQRWESEIPEPEIELYDAAHAEYMKLIDFIRRGGRNSKDPIPLTQIGISAMRGAGGFNAFCDATEWRLKQLKEKFLELHQSLTKQQKGGIK